MLKSLQRSSPRVMEFLFNVDHLDHVAQESEVVEEKQGCAGQRISEIDDFACPDVAQTIVEVSQPTESSQPAEISVNQPAIAVALPITADDLARYGYPGFQAPRYPAFALDDSLSVDCSVLRASLAYEAARAVLER